MKFNCDYNSDFVRKLIVIIITIYSTIKINLNNYNYDQIFDILPRTNLKEKKENINLTDIFESRQLYIYDKNLTKEYIHFIRPLKKRVKKEKSIILENGFYSFENRTSKLKYKDFIKICNSEILIDENITKSNINIIFLS